MDRINWPRVILGGLPTGAPMENPKMERAYQRHAWVGFVVLGILCLGFGIHSLLVPLFDPTHWDWLSKDRAVYRYRTCCGG